MSFLPTVGLALLVIAGGHAGQAQPGLNAWPPAEQAVAARTPLTIERLQRIERVVTALAALSKRDSGYCEWLKRVEHSTSVSEEAAMLMAHAGVRGALAAGPVAPREFVEGVFALLVAGMSHGARGSGVTAPGPVPPPANVGFFAANQTRIERVFALDPC